MSPGDALSREAVEAVDRSGMLDEVLAQPLQLGDALWRVESARVPGADAPGGLLVCGMGGSAIGGDLAAAAAPGAGGPGGVVRRGMGGAAIGGGLGGAGGGGRRTPPISPAAPLGI